MAAHHPSLHFDATAGRVAWDVEGEGPNVILVHGTPAHSIIWRGVIDRLRAQYKVHYLDLPGYGASAKFDGQEVRLRAFARTLREFVDHLGIDRPHLIGHDFGAAAVMGAHLIEEVPVASIAIADGVVLSPWGTPFSRHVRDHEGVFAAVPEYIHRATLQAHLATAVWHPLSAGMENALITPWTGAEGQAAYYRQVGQYDYEYTEWLEERYAQVAVPQTVLWGEQDQWVALAEGRRFHGMIPDAEWVTLPDAGHFSMVDCPGLFARELDHHLQRAGAAPA